MLGPISERLCILGFRTPRFRKLLPVVQSVYQTVWIQIRPDIMSGLVWVQIICKGYQSRGFRKDEIVCTIFCLISA